MRLKANSIPVRKYFRNFRILWSNRGSLRFGPPRTRGFFQTATNRLPTWTVKHAELLMCLLRCQTVTLRLLLRIPLRADFWQGGINYGRIFWDYFSVRRLDIFTR